MSAVHDSLEAAHAWLDERCEAHDMDAGDWQHPEYWGGTETPPALYEVEDQEKIERDFKDAVAAAKDLYDLRDALNEYNAACAYAEKMEALHESGGDEYSCGFEEILKEKRHYRRADFDVLDMPTPTFGGERPDEKKYCNFESWDEKNILFFDEDGEYFVATRDEEDA
ncbi:hypothetical protein VF14_18470 [Nostoc linckia z18]|uniref:Uncharacterized protein n=3 Tax=Nostoc linckia TaxID=92942 RepID=A0A9Q5Z985_NOSLI|nr:hypothetical protein VF02_37580 [Nostoc linckia z1]PHJ82011.1 hypothetical protein VF07_29425 [Nostoc linckia z6]PHJ83748.1 hypothetical protein VF04_36625 [Nostoc linckia z7]PHK00824.1 hypothetical protein VF08_23465 [Nostoc linckia z8]PHK09356.1 hypothetical protein VF09_16205 [Nostoc linckia z9]PHK09565.1 hypothetical protein VF10_36145 [Nostoc linckia z13]PHK33099.1 hypothetical protein VF14_18470 [Nostoc linckia z18]